MAKSASALSSPASSELLHNLKARSMLQPRFQEDFTLFTVASPQDRGAGYALFTMNSIFADRFTTLAASFRVLRRARLRALYEL